MKMILRYKREIVGGFIALAAFFLALSLFTFNPSDNALFFSSLSKKNVSNAAGQLGAQLSSICMYLMGGSSFLLVYILLFISYLIIIRGAIKREWDRLAAFAIAVPVVAALSTLYGFDWQPVGYPGGLLGHSFYRLLLSTFDAFSATLLLWVLFTVCLVVLLRCSYMVLFSYIVAAAKVLVNKETFIDPLIRIACSIYAIGIQIIQRPLLWLKNLVLGKDLEQEQYADVAVEHLVSSQEGNDITKDSFWQNYLESSSSLRACNGADNNVGNALVLDEYQVDFSVQEPDNVMEQATVIDKAAIKKKPTTRLNVKPRYALPSLDIFIGVDQESEDAQLMQELEQRALILEEKLERFGISGKVVAIKRGPVVTLFEYKPQIDSKISKIISLEDDLAMALQALSIRIIAPIPGRAVVGFEVANKNRRSVLLSSVLQSPVFGKFSGSLPLALGEDTIGNKVLVDLVKMPHLLIAGSTGSGKSVALNTMLISLLCKLSPDELKLVLIDPKRLEFASYADIAHLIFPIVTNPKQAAPVLKWVVNHMEERYEMMAECGARSILDYNKIMARNDEETLPFIVVIIDELSDLMMTAGREIEDLIARITQMARAAGIHMIVATQRPSVDVITGLIKVNFPSRISFRVTSKIDSRTILDCAGADKLLGRGDMLFLDAQDSSLKRVHGAYVSDKEIEDLVSHIKAERQVEYLDLSQEIESMSGELSDQDDELYKEVLEFLEELDEVSISLLQRRFRIGYNRSARIIDTLESQGVISPSGSGKMRKVLRS